MLVLLAAAADHAHEVTLAVGDLIKLAGVLVVIAGAVVEARVRIVLLTSRVKKVEEDHIECNREQTAHYQEIKEILAEIKTEVAVAQRDLEYLAEKAGKPKETKTKKS
ncbi:MAG: hypothetical protein JSW58_08375 [Candidatus Latescibacterota bacterium]|nr:MAG: hypothetical protein JSW58_08375 [Candidatus Latescibacterota bacterium]